MKTILLKVLSGISGILFLASCASGTGHIAPVQGFNIDRYTGTWYEIARMPNDFEKGLSNVSASYFMREDGDIGVVNKGYDFKKQEWREIRAYAYQSSSETTGELSIVFFWPFRAKYKIIFLDVDYQYAVVTGSAMSYLWILSRNPQMPAGVLKSLTGKARAWGYDTERLIIVNQDMNLVEYSNRDTSELPSELDSRLMFE